MTGPLSSVIAVGKDNHDWIWDRFAQLSDRSPTPLTALDFGCGDGRLITRSLAEGTGEFYGSETFYGDGAVALDNGDGADVPEATRARIRITEPGQPLPFPDATFDFVSSNQVFEHIHDLPATVAELARVTKPGGTHLHVFPTRERLVEGHLGVPLIHRLPEPRRERWAARWYPRVRYGATTTSFDQWWNEMGPFLRDHTIYRTAAAYDRAFGVHFDVHHRETAKLGYHLHHSRLHRLAPLAQLVPRRVEHTRTTSTVELRTPSSVRPPSDR